MEVSESDISVSQWYMRLTALFVERVARWFNLVPVPQRFAEVIADRNTTIVLRGASWIHEALLLSLVRRAGGLRVLRLSATSPITVREGFVSFLCVEDVEAVSRVVRGDPRRVFVTLSTFYGRGPLRSGRPQSLGLLDGLGLFLGRRVLICSVGGALQVPSDNPRGAHMLQRALRVDFAKTLRLVRGVPFQSMSEQERVVIGGRDWNDELRSVANAMQVSTRAAQQLARKEFQQMAANPRRFVFIMLEPIVRFILERLFGQRITIGLERFREAARNHPVVLVPMHRSHFDYVLVAYQLYQAHLNTPLVAAGANLRFWPLGWIFRSLGGYYVRRSARGDRIHALLLRRYVNYLFRRGHLQEFFIEGGRSRSGKMRSPKLGLLKIFCESALQSTQGDIYFVPVGITYEEVIEDESFADENTGRAKEKENVWSLLRALSVFKRSYGDVVLSFGKPISLNSIVDEMGTRETRRVVAGLAKTIVHRIRDEVAPSLSSLAATALLASPRYGLRREELEQTLRNLATLIEVQCALSPAQAAATPSLTSFLAGRTQLLDELPRGGFIAVSHCLGGDVFYVPGKKRFVADFYRNSVAHLFFDVGLLSLLVALRRDATEESYRPFYELFAADYLLPDWNEYRARFARFLDALIRAEILRPQSSPLEFAVPAPGFYLPGWLLATVQSYYWVLLHIEQIPLAGREVLDEGAVEERSCRLGDLMSRLQSEFKAASYLGSVGRTEASSLSTIQGALDSLAQLGYVTVQEGRNGNGRVIVQGDIAKPLRLMREANDALVRGLVGQMPDSGAIEPS